MIYLGPAQDKASHGKLSPGPFAPYELCSAVGKQVHSKTASAPQAAFSKASRWATYEREVSPSAPIEATTAQSHNKPLHCVVLMLVRTNLVCADEEKYDSRPWRVLSGEEDCKSCARYRADPECRLHICS